MFFFLHLEVKSCKTTTQITKIVPKEQHDWKHFIGQWHKHHTELDGLLQVLLGNVEAVVVDLVVEEDVLMPRAFLQQRFGHMLLVLVI